MTSTAGRSEHFTYMTAVDPDVHPSIPLDDLAEYCRKPHRPITKNLTYIPVNRSGWNRYLGGKIETE